MNKGTSHDVISGQTGISQPTQNTLESHGSRGAGADELGSNLPRDFLRARAFLSKVKHCQGCTTR